METTIKERPILFSAPMVRALLDGSKKQTRRIVKGMALDWLENAKFTPEYVADPDNSMCPYGKVGDRLWVRETWRGWVCINPPSESRQLAVARYVPAQMECKRLDYKATQAADNEPYRPSIHMPRWASRINLEIAAVRIERLNDISEADANSEGVEIHHEPWDQTIAYRDYSAPDAWIPAWMETYDTAATLSFKSLWESINGFGSWQENPWVWVVEFKRV